MRKNSNFYATFVPQNGEVQEWLNWLAWKVSKRQKCFRGSNPLLSAKGQTNDLHDFC